MVGWEEGSRCQDLIQCKGLHNDGPFVRGLFARSLLRAKGNITGEENIKNMQMI